MRGWLTGQLLKGHRKATQWFDAWVFHGRHIERAYCARTVSAMALIGAMVAIGTYVLVYQRPHGAVVASGYLLLIPVLSVMALKMHEFLFHPAGNCPPYHRAVRARQQEENDGEFDALFVRRCLQLGNDRDLYHLCRVEWWFARALWNENRKLRLARFHYEQALPAPSPTAHLPRARL